MDSNKSKESEKSKDNDSLKDNLSTSNNSLEKVVLPMRSSNLRGNPPALIRNSAGQTFLNPKSETLSDGELSDFSLNDTEEDEEEFRNCILINGTQIEGTEYKNVII